MNPLRFRKAGMPEPLSERAAAWLLRAEKGNMSRPEQRAFHEWLKVPAHARAYEDAIWALDTVQLHAGSHELMEMRSLALAQQPEKKTRGPLTAMVAAVAATLAFAVLLLGPWQAQQPAMQGADESAIVASADIALHAAKAGIYRTSVGESLSLILPDGSVSTLDTDSRIEVMYDGGERGVRLMDGQAYFEVAKNEAVPFNVYAGGSRITAVGTAFNVRLEAGTVSVDMSEGEVRVVDVDSAQKALPSSESLTLRAGELLLATEIQGPTVKPIEMSRVATWRGGLLVFQDKTLSEAVAEVNRYTRDPIILSDPTIGDYRVTGVFITNKPKRFAQAMTEIFPLESATDENGRVSLRKAD